MILLLTLLNSCKEGLGTAGEVELYLLSSFSTIGEGCAIEESSVELNTRALIPYQDLLSYEPATCTFNLSLAAADTVKNLEHSVRGIAFAVTADGELVYTGYFWPSYSSLACQWITTDPLFIFGEKQLKMGLAYPGLMDGENIPDRRNDPHILEIFRNDGKLIE